MRLADLQGYIEAENNRLESEQRFSGREIVVRIEYRHCPNLTLIDTPGLISAAPGKKNEKLQGFSTQVEAIVKAKIEQREHIILCLEDSNDWTNATTRRLVMQVDPSLSRTVLVSTKFDTKLPQFARGADVETFLHPSKSLLGLGDSKDDVSHANTEMMGNGRPFFTSVPSGRVGETKDDVFRSNDEFRSAVANRESQDTAEAESKLGRKLSKEEKQQMGVGQLRFFLEKLLQSKYLDSVPLIVPLLDKEMRAVQSKLASIKEELGGLAQDKMKEKGRVLVEGFLSRLHLLLKGSAMASPEKFGETSSDEHMRGGGAFVGVAGKILLSNPDASIPNAMMRLFGGAQFHRAMSEFRLSVGQIQCPMVTKEEIANACGIDEAHDGVNFMRAACVIAVARAKETLEPLIHQLGARLSHVLRRLLPISLFLLQRDGQSALTNGDDRNNLFLDRMSSCYNAFLEDVERSCKAKCLEDLESTTRYVTWSLHAKNTRGGLKSVISKMRPDQASSQSQKASGSTPGPSAPDPSSSNSLLDLIFDQQMCTLGSSGEELVHALVSSVYEGIRDFVVQAAELKFNCFFLMPVVDSFPLRMRADVEGSFDQGLIEQVFDIKAVKRSLESKQSSLMSELKQVEKIQHKFRGIHATLIQQAVQGGADPTLAPGGGADRAGSHRIKVDSSLALSVQELKNVIESDTQEAHDNHKASVTPLKAAGLTPLSKAATPIRTIHNDTTTLPLPPASASKDQTTPLNSVAARANALMQKTTPVGAK